MKILKNLPSFLSGERVRVRGPFNARYCPTPVVRSLPLIRSVSLRMHPLTPAHFPCGGVGEV